MVLDFSPHLREHGDEFGPGALPPSTLTLLSPTGLGHPAPDIPFRTKIKEIGLTNNSFSTQDLAGPRGFFFLQGTITTKVEGVIRRALLLSGLGLLLDHPTRVPPDLPSVQTPQQVPPHHIPPHGQSSLHGDLRRKSTQIYCFYKSPDIIFYRQ